MLAENNIQPKLSRITIIDSLRGFSLIGILFAHISAGFSMGFPERQKPIFIAILDGIINAINGLLISGKFFMIFSFLFGLSYFIQMDRASKKGYNFKWRFLWRIIILLAIGYLHSLFFSADILIIYAILGIPLVFLYKVKNRILLLIIILLFAGLPRFVDFGYNKYQDYSLTQEQKAAKLNEKPVGFEEMMKKGNEIIQNGLFIDMVKFNSVDGLKGKAEFQLGVMGRGYQTFALFLLGLMVGRFRFFENIDENIKLTRKALKWSAITSGITLALTVLFGLLAMDDFQQVAKTGTLNSIFSMIAISFYDLFNLALTIVIAAGFILLYQKQKYQKKLVKLAPYGRMALTNYILQSLIAITIFYGWGLGMIRFFGPFTSVLLGIVIFIFQLFLSKWWLSKYNYGPMEWFWRSATYLKWQSFVKNSEVNNPKVILYSN